MLFRSDSGIHYGQGYYIQRPSSEILNIHPNIKAYILNRNLIKQGIKVQNITTVKIGKISKNMPYIGLDTVGEQVSVLFEKELEVQGLPVVDKEKPVGLLMKHTFYRHLGKQYGYPIFMKRSIEQLMDKTPLVVDCDIPLDRVSEIAMTRNTDALYDYIIVTKEDRKSVV